MTRFVGQRQLQAITLAIWGFGQLHPHAHAALGRFFVQRAHPAHVAVAVDLHALAQVLEAVHRVFGIQPPNAFGFGGFGAVDLQADQFFLQVVVAQAIAVVQLGGRVVGGDLNMLSRHLADPANRLTGIFGRVKRADVFFAALHKVVGELAVEVLVRVGLEAEGGAAMRSGRQFGALAQHLVEQLAVMRCDVLHIGHVLVAAFDLEAAHARVHQCAQVLALVVVLHAQHMLVVCHDAALRVFDLIGQTAGLRAVASIGAAPGVGVADEALAAVGHAQSAMHKKLDHGAIGVHRVADGGDLRQRQLAGQHDLAQSGILQKSGFFGRADVSLGAGMQLNGRHVDFEQAHVLDDQCVDACVIQLPCQFSGTFELVIAQDGVERDKDAAVKAVRMLHQLGDVLHRVVGRRPCPKGGTANVDRVRAVVDGFDANVQVAGGGQEFEVVGLHGLGLSQLAKQATRQAASSGAVGAGWGDVAKRSASEPRPVPAAPERCMHRRDIKKRDRSRVFQRRTAQITGSWLCCADLPGRC